MSGHIRGHYRIDSAGRVEPLMNVNAAARPYTIPETHFRRKAVSIRLNWKRLTAAAVIGCILVTQLGRLLQPRIERAVLSIESAHLASLRASYIQSHPVLESLLAKRR